MAVYDLPVTPTRAQVLDFIAAASLYGNLGLFVGTGFSKGVLNSDREVALSWGALLDRACTVLGVKLAAVLSPGDGYPAVATKICRLIASTDGVGYEEAVNRFKATVAALTAWYPNTEQRAAFAPALQTLDPQWIITTNYDLVLESILTGRSVTLGPNAHFSAPKGVIPVYHLHGVRTDPHGIVLLQEDYVAQFRPGEYRQLRLSLCVSEATSLLLGYGLGDINVQTAIDWSRNVFPSESNRFPRRVIQMVWSPNPSVDPYLDPSGVVIVESASIPAFLGECAASCQGARVRDEEHRAKLLAFANALLNPTQDTVAKFLDDSKFRREVLSYLPRYAVELAPGLISTIERCVGEAYKRSSAYGAFQGYDDNLKMLLDVLVVLDAMCPPAVLQSAVFALNVLAPLIGLDLGQSHAAGRTWSARRKELSPALAAEVSNIAREHDLVALRRLMTRP